MRPTRSRQFAALASTAVLLTGLAACSGSDDSADGAACDYPDSTEGPAAKEVEKPPTDASGTEQTVTITTNSGEVHATLDGAAAPCTVNSFVSLAEQGYFDNTPCHRLTVAPMFGVLQCGDPTGSGMGGPGYSFADELSGDETYPAGTLAMANSGADTNGSQFFLVHEDTRLDPDYTVFGTVDEASLKVLRGIAAGGTADGAPDGAPAQPVTIESVTVD